jgi:hypothetical protein
MTGHQMTGLVFASATRVCAHVPSLQPTVQEQGGFGSDPDEGRD